MRWDVLEVAHGRDDSFLEGVASPGVLGVTQKPFQIRDSHTLLMYKEKSQPSHRLYIFRLQ